MKREHAIFVAFAHPENDPQVHKHAIKKKKASLHPKIYTTIIASECNVFCRESANVLICLFHVTFGATQIDKSFVSQYSVMNYY